VLQKNKPILIVAAVVLLVLGAGVVTGIIPTDFGKLATLVVVHE